MQIIVLELSIRAGNYLESENLQIRQWVALFDPIYRKYFITLFGVPNKCQNVPCVKILLHEPVVVTLQMYRKTCQTHQLAIKYFQICVPFRYFLTTLQKRKLCFGFYEDFLCQISSDKTVKTMAQFGKK